jgi:hypothetical protein
MGDYSNPTPKPYTKDLYQQLKRGEFVSDKVSYVILEVAGVIALF